MGDRAGEGARRRPSAACRRAAAGRGAPPARAGHAGGRAGDAASASSGIGPRAGRDAGCARWRAFAERGARPSCASSIEPQAINAAAMAGIAYRARPRRGAGADPAGRRAAVRRRPSCAASSKSPRRSGPRVTLVPSHDGDGTNALLLAAARCHRRRASGRAAFSRIMSQAMARHIDCRMSCICRARAATSTSRRDLAALCRAQADDRATPFSQRYLAATRHTRIDAAPAEEQ